MEPKSSDRLGNSNTNLEIRDLNNKIDEAGVDTFELKNIARIIYLFFDGKLKNNIFSSLLTYGFGITILISLVSSIAQTISTYRFSPPTCSSPACNDDPTLCPGKMMCEPVPLPGFAVVDAACIYIFTIEYGTKLLTAWAVSSSEADIAPKPSEDEPLRVYPLWEFYLRYFFAFSNLVDFLTILPYYIALGNGGDAKGAAFLRVFRLLRFFRLMNSVKEAQIMLNLVVTTVKESLLALGILVALVLLGMVFYGSIIFLVEQGKFTVNENFPTGAFIRVTVNGASYEKSPFISVPESFYWVMTTLSTVGYGDLYPTSWIGRMIANIVMMTGLVTLALPIGVIGTKFYELYQEVIENHWKSADEALHISGMDENAINKLFETIDFKHQGFIDESELLIALRMAGMQVSELFVHNMLKYSDHDHNGVISREEFLTLCKLLQQHKIGHPDSLHPELALDLLSHQLHVKSAKAAKATKSTKLPGSSNFVLDTKELSSQLPPAAPPRTASETSKAPTASKLLFTIPSIFGASAAPAEESPHVQADQSSETTSVNSQESRIAAGLASSPEDALLHRKVNVLKRRIEYLCKELDTLANKP